MSGNAPINIINNNIMNNNSNISIHDNKREYLKEKERKDTEALEIDLKREKDKLNKFED